MAVLNRVLRRHRPSFSGWEKVAKVAITLQAVLLPLLVTSTTSEPWELGKTYLVLVTAAVAGFATLADWLLKKHHDCQGAKLDWLMLGVAVVSGLATVFSVRPIQSFSGLSNWYADSLLVTLALAGTASMVSHTWRTSAERRLLAGAYGLGVGLAILALMFQVAGVEITPFALPADPLASLLGNTPSQNSIMAGLLTAWAFFVWMAQREQWAKLLSAVGVVAGWLAILLIGHPVGWAVLAVGMIVAVLWQAQLGKHSNQRAIIIAVAVAALGMILQFSGLRGLSGLPRPQEISLDQATSRQIAVTTLKQHPLLGSGLSTWYQDFVTNRPTSFNQQQYWNIRFIKAGNQWWHIMATQGIVGLLAWIGLLGGGLWFGWKTFSNRPGILPAGSLLLVAVMAITAFFTTWSFVMLGGFWLSLGLIAAELKSERRKERPIPTVGTLGAAVGLLALLVISWPAARFYWSEVALRQGEELRLATRPLAHVEAKLTSALAANPWNARASVLLANAQLTRAQIAASQGQQADVTAPIQSSLATMREAIKRDPRNPALYEEMNNLLNRLTSLVSDADMEAKKYFQELIKLEPANPVHHVGYGQVLLIERANLLAAEQSGREKKAVELLEEALASFDTALEKKPDYLQARLAKAEAFVTEGKYSEALAELDQLDQSVSGSALVWAERGFVLARLKRKAEAQQAFEKVLDLAPRDPSGYLLYAREMKTLGDAAEAEKVLERGLRQLPNQTDLQQELAGLEGA